MAAQDPNVYTGFGIPALLAQELAAQVTAGVGDSVKIRGAGVSGPYAVATAALITGGQSDPVILANATGIGRR